MVSTLEQMQVRNGTGPGVRRRRRPLLAKCVVALLFEIVCVISTGALNYSNYQLGLKNLAVNEIAIIHLVWYFLSGQMDCSDPVCHLILESDQFIFLLVIYLILFTDQIIFAHHENNYDTVVLASINLYDVNVLYLISKLCWRLWY